MKIQKPAFFLCVLTASLCVGIHAQAGVRAKDNVHFANCHEGPNPDAVPHMPFARKALDGSFKKKLASGQPLPSYEDGRNVPSVYVVSVADAVSVAEKTFQKGIGRRGRCIMKEHPVTEGEAAGLCPAPPEI